MLIDVNVQYGGRESIQRFTQESLERELGRTPVIHTLVGSNLGTFDQRAANDDLLTVCQDHAGWIPAPTVQPRDTFVWESEIDRMVAAGIRAFRLDPEGSAWPVDSVFLSTVLEKLSESGSVVIIPATLAGLPSIVAEASAEFGVPVIFTEARYFPLTEILPLMKRFDHLHIETSRLTSPGGIALCVEEVGAHRLVYGSGSCRYPAWIAWRMLEEARIADDDREAIAAGNARNLLGLDEQTAPRTAIPGIMLHSVQNHEIAESLPPPSIDVHLHDRFPGAPFPAFDAASYEQALAENAIVGGISSSATAIFHDLELGNDQQEELLDAIPILRGYVVIDPRYPDDSEQELERLARDDRWVGAKIHCAYARTSTSSDSMHRLLAMVDAFSCPVLIHPLGTDWPEALSSLARRHPNLTLIAAHAGYGDGPHPTHDAAPRLAGESNIVIEFCSTYLASGAIRRGIESVGVERVLFGSDFPLISLPYMRTAYREAELTSEETDDIYWRNAIRIFPALSKVTEGRLAPAT